MRELIEQAKRDVSLAKAILAHGNREQFPDPHLARGVIHALGVDVEWLVAENERLRRERDRLFACIAEQEHRDNQRIGGNHVQFRHALETTMWALKSQTAPCSETVATLAAHDREQESHRA